MSGMDRREAAAIFRDMAITRTRTDVPADVAEAMGEVLASVSAQAEDLDAVVHGARGETAMLAAGWPGHTAWQPTPAVEAVLERLCAARREALVYEWSAVSDPAPPQVAQTYGALRAGLEAAGLPPKLAEWAADFSRLTDLGGIVEVVRWTAMPKPEGWAPLPQRWGKS